MQASLPFSHDLHMVIWTVASGLSNSMTTLIVVRFFCGLSASCTMAIVGGVVADVMSLEEQGAAAALWSFGPMAAPVVGPIA